ncbi:PP2C family protein-serine/threonine phosphatase [Trebonia sp.]|uniref:PP2C family protein-serine/threonine phosphatase n=1 Tax=Trebonia sp. TaxID=2767075 RepID=UPI0026223EAD|nr:PP2C family protein-serine/threonine phosphatase [Trebonia sp.]
MRKLRAAGGWLSDQARQQFITRNRRVAFGLTLVTVVIAVAAVHVSVWWFSPGVMILPILCGGLLLWPRALRILFVIAGIGVAYDVVKDKAGAGIVATIVVTAFFADVLARTRGKLGTRGLRADRMMIELRDRIRAQGTLPELGEGWGSTVVLRPAGGSSFGGDFVVSSCEGSSLEVALVDVSGKGMDAATRALLLSGAFGGVLGSVPRDSFLPACNAYLRRGRAPEGFVTAVHLAVDLVSGEYTLSSAGHPPAVRFDANTGRWQVSRARGIVLGVVPDLASVPDIPDKGVLRRGDAIMLYTDGLVEAPRRDIDEGIERLLGEAERLVVAGFRTGAPELVTAMQRAIGSADDCALVLIWRS